MGHQSGWRHEPGSYKAYPNEAVTSLKSKQVTYRHKGDMAGDAVFPLQGTEVTVVSERSLSRELSYGDLTL